MRKGDSGDSHGRVEAPMFALRPPEKMEPLSKYLF